MMAVTCFLTSPSPAGVDLSNIVRMTPKVSADGPQEPTHDILQVGEGSPHGPYTHGPASPHNSVGGTFPWFPDGRHRFRRSEPTQQAQASLSVQPGLLESMSKGLSEATVICPPTHMPHSGIGAARVDREWIALQT